MPADIAAQLELHRNGALVFDAGGRTQLEVHGSDAQTFLHKFCSQEVSAMEQGDGGETFFCDVRGKVLGHGFIYRRADSLLIETVANQATPLREHLDRYVITEDVEFKDCSNERPQLAVIGRDAAKCVSEVFSAAPPVAPVALVGVRADVEVCSTTAYGSDGFHVQCSNDAIDAIHQTIIDWGAVAADEQAVELIRIAAGAPRYGVDIDQNNLPQEIDRDDAAISFVKGCYLGQETVARIDALGHVNWRLVGIVCPPGAKSGMQLLIDDKAVGDLRSCAQTPSGDAVIGLALIRRAHANEGSTISSPAGECTVRKFPIPIPE